MKKLFAALTVSILAGLFFAASDGYAVPRDEKQALMEKLCELRKKKNQMMDAYKVNTMRITKETDENITMMKSDFRRARQRCLDEKHKRLDELRDNFESELRPLLKEEEVLIEEIGRDAREDFVRVKTKRGSGK